MMKSPGEVFELKGSASHDLESGYELGVVSKNSKFVLCDEGGDEEFSGDEPKGA